MSKIVLGKTPKGKVICIDLKVLLRTRLLLQANSGGGKSWGIRRLVEQLFGKVQIIILDREGEFASLCDKYDFLLVGQGHDIPADVRSARMLAEKLLEHRASAICDLYEAFRTSQIKRMEWVREFLLGLVDAPKSLLHDVVVIVDEAHLLCPQVEPKGRNMEEREIISGCKEAMIALATVGRKRGQCAVWATQRLAKLDKDASAELANRMVGMTMEDTDVDRAIDLMSVGREDRLAFRKSLRELEPGQFYVFGRAVANERTLMKFGPVETHHQEAGNSKGYEPPPPSEKVKTLLAKLADLPKEAETKARTEKELRAENAALKQQLAAALKKALKQDGLKLPVVPKIPVVQKIEVPVLKEAELKRLERLAEKIGTWQEKASQTSDVFKRAILEIKQIGNPKSFEKLQDERIREAHDAFPTPGRVTKFAGAPSNISAYRSVAPKIGHDEGASSEESLLAGERKMLGVLAQFHPGSRTRSQLGALAGYTPSGGTFGQYYGKLKRLKLIKEGPDGSISITEAGLEWFGGEIPEGPKSAQELLAMWRGKLLQGERKMLDILVEAYPSMMSKQDLGEKSGYTSSGGTFGQYLGTLRRNALVLVDGDGVRASETLFDLSAGVA
jgi:hypothetical protein